MDSEQYRQMLVRDGERRFREWHTAFLAYQKQFQQTMAAKVAKTPRPAIERSTPTSNSATESTASDHDAVGTDNAAMPEQS